MGLSKSYLKYCMVKILTLLIQRISLYSINAQNLVTSNFVVESISGDPKELELQTVFQDYPSKAYTPIYGVEEIKS